MDSNPGLLSNALIEFGRCGNYCCHSMTDAKQHAGFAPLETLPAEWYNNYNYLLDTHINQVQTILRQAQTEIANVLEAGGQTPDATSTCQLLPAINHLIADARPVIATGSEPGLVASSNASNAVSVDGATGVMTPNALCDWSNTSTVKQCIDSFVSGAGSVTNAICFAGCTYAQAKSDIRNYTPSLATNATCFGGCTYACAKADFRSGLTSCTGTVTSISVYCGTTCKCSITTSGSICLGSNAFNSTAFTTCTGTVTISNKAAANASTPVALCTCATAVGRSTGCALTFNTSTGVLTAAAFSGTLCGPISDGTHLIYAQYKGKALSCGEITHLAAWTACCNTGGWTIKDTNEDAVRAFLGLMCCACYACCATCFAGCTYACAKADFRTGLTSCTGTVTSICIACCSVGSAGKITTSGTICLSKNAFAQYATISTASYPGACCTGDIVYKDLGTVGNDCCVPVMICTGTKCVGANAYMMYSPNRQTFHIPKLVLNKGNANYAVNAEIGATQGTTGCVTIFKYCNTTIRIGCYADSCWCCSSVSLGDEARVCGGYSAAIGANARAQTESVSVGHVAVAANYAVSVGHAAVAAIDAVAIGRYAGACPDSIAIGTQAGACANSSVAIGACCAQVTAEGGIALGRNARVSVARGLAVGYNAVSEKICAVSISQIGPLVIASWPDATVECAIFYGLCKYLKYSSGSYPGNDVSIFGYVKCSCANRAIVYAEAACLRDRSEIVLRNENDNTTAVYTAANATTKCCAGYVMFTDMRCFQLILNVRHRRQKHEEHLY